MCEISKKLKVNFINVGLQFYLHFNLNYKTANATSIYKILF